MYYKTEIIKWAKKSFKGTQNYTLEEGNDNKNGTKRTRDSYKNRKFSKRL